MNKAQFIQHIIIRTCPGHDKIQPAIAHGEWLWDELTQAGYGDKAPAQPRELKDDYYSQLTGPQKIGFDKFWSAFNYKTGKQRAALRWGQLGELDVNGYKKIIAAAEKEALRDFKGQARKHAEGWLSERRWQDTEQEPGKTDQREYQKLTSELNGLKQLYQSSPNESLLASITKKEAELNTLRQNNRT
jgi:hypothetical protein